MGYPNLNGVCMSEFHTFHEENLRRAKRGMDALIRHQVDDGPLTHDGPVDYLMVADMLADIRHLCDWKGVTFDEAVRLSETHHTEELYDPVN